MRNGNLHRWRCVVVLPLALLGLVTGCGDGSSGVGAPSATGSTSGDAVLDLAASPEPDAPGGVEAPDGPWPVAYEAARTAAVDGLTAYLSYRWDTLEEDANEARALSSAEFWNESSGLWDTLAETVPDTKTVSDITVLANGVVAQDETYGVFLVLLDQATSAAGGHRSDLEQSVLVTVVADADADEADAGEAGWLLDDVSTTPSDAVAASGGPVDAAERLVRALSTYGGEAVERGRLRRMEEAVANVATTEFFDEFLAQRDMMVNLVETGEQSEFTLIAAALADIDADSATVLVSGSRTTIRDGEEQDPLGQRLSVEMVLTDGTWLASDLTPVG